MNRRAITSNPHSSWGSILALAAGGLLFATAGCGGGPEMPENIPPLTPTTITVTYNGEPVEGASIVLAPESGEFPAAGLTDASGTAVMKTEGMYAGVAAGNYLASVTKLEKVDNNIGTAPTDPAKYAEYQKKLESRKIPKHLVPEKYSSFGTSGLSVAVTEGKPVQETFELTD